MTDRESLRKDFEKYVTIPTELEWSEEEHGYLPIRKLEGDVHIIDLAHNVNTRFADYITGRNESLIYITELEKLLIQASDIIERSIFSDPQTEKLVNDLKLALTEKKG